jgi:hypothetical protein
VLRLVQVTKASGKKKEKTSNKKELSKDEETIKRLKVLSMSISTEMVSLSDNCQGFHQCVWCPESLVKAI